MDIKEAEMAPTSNEERKLLKERNTLEEIESRFTAVVCFPHFMIGITPNGIYLIKKENGEYYIKKEIPHDWEVAYGNPIMLDGNLYLWTHGHCYALVETIDTSLLSNPKLSLPKPLWALTCRKTLSDLDIQRMQYWHWHEIDADDLMLGYLNASGRSDLNTRVTDRETRARNRENALRELCSKEWASKVKIRENQAWSIRQEIQKIEKELDAIKWKRDQKAREDKRKAEREEISGKKSHIVAALLAIFLGGIGAHKFYMGKKMQGIIYLAFSWTWIPSVIGILSGLKWLVKGKDCFIDDIIDDDILTI